MAALGYCHDDVIYFLMTSILTLGNAQTILTTFRSEYRKMVKENGEAKELSYPIQLLIREYTP